MRVPPQIAAGHDMLVASLIGDVNYENVHSVTVDADAAHVWAAAERALPTSP